MNRGSRRSHQRGTAGARASMRPRFMNRGSKYVATQDGEHAWASMRPRFMNRGSSFMSFSLLVLRFRFNEAPIHESGK